MELWALKKSPTGADALIENRRPLPGCDNSPIEKNAQNIKNAKTENCTNQNKKRSNPAFHHQYTFSSKS
jgi:adenine-specific DNA glycosylase